MVKRYEPDISIGGEWGSSAAYMAESPDGEYVKFSDYERLRKEHSALLSACLLFLREVANGSTTVYEDSGNGCDAIEIAVDEQIVMRPESQTVDQIRSEQNEEVKRIRIERFTWERYLRESNAKRIHHRRNDIEGTLESLYETPDGWKTLVCACPSTAKVFALEVEPSIATCDAAQSYLSSGLSGRIISAS